MARRPAAGAGGRRAGRRGRRARGAGGRRRRAPRPAPATRRAARGVAAGGRAGARRREPGGAGRAAGARRRAAGGGARGAGGRDDAGRGAARLRGRRDARRRRGRARAGPGRGAAPGEPRRRARAAAAPGAGRAPRRPRRSGRRRRLPLPRRHGDRRTARHLRDADARPRLQGRHRRGPAAARARRRRPHARRRAGRRHRGAGAARPARDRAARPRRAGLLVDDAAGRPLRPRPAPGRRRARVRRRGRGLQVLRADGAGPGRPRRGPDARRGRRDVRPGRPSDAVCGACAGVAPPCRSRGTLPYRLLALAGAYSAGRRRDDTCHCDGPALDGDRAAAFAERLGGVLNDASLALMLSIGHQVGLFDAMAGRPPATSEEIALAAGLNERYVREWLGAMVDRARRRLRPGRRTYRLPAEHAAWLTRAAGTDNLAVQAAVRSRCWRRSSSRSIDCFRHGGGVPYAAFPRFHELMAEDSGARHDAALIDTILPLVPGLAGRLAAGIDVADVGCGSGHAINLMARAFPTSRFVGYDFSEEAFGAGRREAAALGLTNAAFEARDAAALGEREPVRPDHRLRRHPRPGPAGAGPGRDRRGAATGRRLPDGGHRGLQPPPREPGPSAGTFLYTISPCTA